MKYLHLLSIGANAILLALMTWLWAVTGAPECLLWMAYAALMGGLSTYALRKDRAVRL